MKVIRTPAHRQCIQATPARPAVEQHGRLDGVGIEQVQDRAKGGLEVHKLALVSPLGDPFAEVKVQEIGRLPRLEGCSGLVAHLILAVQDEVDLLAAVLLEGRDDLPNRLVLPGMGPLLPPDDEAGGVGGERGRGERHGENNGFSAHDVASLVRHRATVMLIS
jgi:hypothetical protein